MNLYQGILAMSGELGTVSSGKVSLYQKRPPEFYAELRSKYPIVEIAGTGSNLNRALNLLHWVYDNNYHRDSDGELKENNALTTFGRSFGKGRENGLNCACLAAALTDCLQAAEIPARTIACFPYNPYDCDNHVVSLPYIIELGKWIVLDPSTNAYLMDDGDNILAPWELRKLLIKRQKIKCNQGVAWHHEYDAPFIEREEEYIRYMAKNSYFYCDCADDCTVATHLLPQGFDLIEFMIKKLTFSKTEFGESPFIDKLLTHFKMRSPVNCASFEEFTKAPE